MFKPLKNEWGLVLGERFLCGAQFGPLSQNREHLVVHTYRHFFLYCTPLCSIFFIFTCCSLLLRPPR